MSRFRSLRHGGAALAIGLVAVSTSAYATPAPSPLDDAGGTVTTAVPLETLDAPAAGSFHTQTAATAPAGDVLLGTFRIDAGVCEGSTPSAGSWFQMQTRSGGFFPNNDSPCADHAYTPLRPGTDGGFTTTGFQPHPDPAFSGGATGDALAARIIEPQPFFGTDFSVATEATDPQSGTKVPVPSIADDGGKLSGDLRAWDAAWNGQHFNQGAPKPDGSTPAPTELPHGTYDSASGHFVLEWKSLIVGGPFDGNTGIWHLEGTFVAASPGAPSTTDATSSSGATPDPNSNSVASNGLQSEPSTTTPRTGGPLPGSLGAAVVLAGLAGAWLTRRRGAWA